MYSANFFGIQLDRTFELYLPEYDIPSPEAQTNYREIKGRDGAIDKTEQFGVVRYKDREWNLTFNKTGKQIDHSHVPVIERLLLNAIHARKGRIIFDDDPNYYWFGRAFVKDVSCQDNGLIIVQVSLITEPYKYALVDKNYVANLSNNSVVLTLENGRKPIIPSVISTDVATLSWTIKGVNYTKTISAGTFKITDLILYEGETELTVSSTGVCSVTVTYPDVQL